MPGRNPNRVGALRSYHSRNDGAGGDDTERLQYHVSNDRGSPLRPGFSRMDGIFSTAGRPYSSTGSVSGGGQRSPRTGGTDGGAFGPDRGGEFDFGPRFDTAVSPGGYLWWYVDGLSDCGRYGLAVIAFIGSAFSPYYAWAGRRHPENHVAINVALYGPRGNRWAMTERGLQALRRGRDYIQVGPSRLDWRGDRLRIFFDEIAVPRPPARFLPRRIRGIVDVYPNALPGATFALDDHGRHVWIPIAPRARIKAAILDGGPVRWHGHGYFDSNWGAEPLERAFRGWDWARGVLGGAETAIIYDTVLCDGARRAISMRADDRGNLERTRIPGRRKLPRGYWGVARTIASEPGGRPRVLQTLEDSPFYIRSLAETRLFGNDVVMMHESFEAKRFASSLVKLALPFRMPRRFW